MLAISQVLRLRVLLVAGFIAAISLSLGQQSNAQSTAPNEWTWIGGSNLAQLPAVYGTLGTPAAANTPGGRGYATSWTDSQGNLWLFGGNNGGLSSFNDLWEYNPSTNEWAWMGGSSNRNQYAMYGTLGTAAAGNNPGSRSGATRWIDKSGNIWLFGGASFGGYYPSFGGSPDPINNYPDDLWEFNPATKEWAWMGGSGTVPCDGCGLPSVYGTMGTPAAGNTPGSRTSFVSWTDSSGNFWLFGGAGFPSKDYEVHCNDLWEFNPSTKEWVWMGGSSTGNQPGVYGTLGTPASGNIPGGRWGGSSWIDQSGNIWIFGGFGFDASGNFGYLSDLWEFNPSTQEWAWMGGSSMASNENEIQPGIYGILGVPAASNIPGDEIEEFWIDNSGNLWLLGNALWEFSPTTKEWTWMGGSSTGYQLGVYGILGTPAPRDFPGTRSGEIVWTDSSGNFWLFGGSGNLGDLNDIWEYQPSSTPSFPTTAKPALSPSGGAYSSVQSVSISDATPGALFYYTTDGSTPTTASTQYTGPFPILGNETIQAIAVAVNYLNSAVESESYVLPAAPAVPIFSEPTGVYTATQTVTISDTTPGASIYYTTDGTTPTIHSTLYIGAITVSSTETVEAIAATSNGVPSALATATYTINRPLDFSISLSPSTWTLDAGQSVPILVTVTPQTGFNSQVSFGCSAGASCNFSPQTVTPGTSPVNWTMMTVTTTATTASLHRDSNPFLPGSALAAVLCCIGWKRRRRLPLLLLAVSVAGLGLLGGCGGKSASLPPSLQPTQSTITVTATSGALTHTTTLTLTVYPTL